MTLAATSATPREHVTPRLHPYASSRIRDERMVSPNGGLMHFAVAHRAYDNRTTTGAETGGKRGRKRTVRTRENP